jgi:hypothetical protein
MIEQETGAQSILLPDESAPSSAAPAAAFAAPSLLVFGFSGSGAEYFRIWIVNLLLTVATFGIYSAWAKTRRLQLRLRLLGHGRRRHGRAAAARPALRDALGAALPAVEHLVPRTVLRLCRRRQGRLAHRG